LLISARLQIKTIPKKHQTFLIVGCFLILDLKKLVNSNLNSNLFIAVSGVSRQLAGRAFRYNLFLFAKRANKKRMNLY